MCECNDYSLLTANTGIVNISVGNPSLTGQNAIPVITGGSNGTIINSIIIKPTGPTTNGMIRLFIGQNGNPISLFREIPIPVFPATPGTPTPQPVWPMLEIDLVEPITLNAGYTLYASTQTSQSFNIFAQGLDWKYPTNLPDVCCNFIQKKANNGIGVVSNSNPNLDGSGTIVPIYTVPPSNGSLIKSITIAALQSTSINGMVRFFVSPDLGLNYYLMMEIVVPLSNQSAFIPSFKQELLLNYYLRTGYILGASTQNDESFAITVAAEEWIYPIQ